MKKLSPSPKKVSNTIQMIRRLILTSAISIFICKITKKLFAGLKNRRKSHQTTPHTFYLLGKCYRHLGEKQKEFDAYRKAVENDPDFLDARFALGTVYAHLTETAEGKQVTYFEIGADKIEIKYIRFFYFYMGLADLALGNLDEARQRQAELRGVDASFRPEQGDWLPDQLQFFIDRFEEELPQDGQNDEDNNWAELLENLRQLVREEPDNAGRAL